MAQSDQYGQRAGVVPPPKPQTPDELLKVYLERLIFAAEMHGSYKAQVRERRHEYHAARKRVADTWFWALGDKVIAMNDAKAELREAEADVERYAQQIEQLKAEILEDARGAPPAGA